MGRFLLPTLNAEETRTKETINDVSFMTAYCIKNKPLVYII